MSLKYAVIATGILLFPLLASAQLLPERAKIRNGNREYEKGDFANSEQYYMQALEADPSSRQAVYNLGNSLFRQERYDEAAQAWAASSAGLDGLSFRSHYNTGNSLVKERKLEEALEQYKQAMRLNPHDMEAKFNYAYTKKLLEKDEDEDQDNQDNDDNQDQDNNNDGDSDGDNDNQDNEDPQNGDDPGNDNDNRDDQQDNNSQEQPSPSGMTRDEAQRMLDAVQMNEDQTREKMDEQKARAVGRSQKNW